MENLSIDSLEKINAGGFWEDVGEWAGEHTLNATWNKLADMYCRNKWNISYKQYCQLTGTESKWD